MTEKGGGRVQPQGTLTKNMAPKFHGSRQAVHRGNRTPFTLIWFVIAQAEAPNKLRHASDCFPWAPLKQWQTDRNVNGQTSSIRCIISLREQKWQAKWEPNTVHVLFLSITEWYGDRMFSLEILYLPPTSFIHFWWLMNITENVNIHCNMLYAALGFIRNRHLTWHLSLAEDITRHSPMSNRPSVQCFMFQICINLLLMKGVKKPKYRCPQSIFSINEGNIETSFSLIKK